jgi:hypothetical protein
MHRFLHMYTNIQQDTTVSWFYCKITVHVSGTLRAHHQEYNNCIWVTGITYVTLGREFCGNVHFKSCSKSDDWSHYRGWIGQLLKWTLPQNSRSNVTYVIPVTVKCSCFTPGDGRGKYPRYVEWSCNKAIVASCWIFVYKHMCRFLVYFVRAETCF